MERGGLDYYGRMFKTFRFLVAWALLATLVGQHALAATATPEDAPANSNLNRDLFYELLVGELSAQSGDTAAAYALLLDAARKSKEPRLYQRAVELALGARSGESALEAARAWNSAFPTSQDANRYLVQILIGLNRSAEIQEPIKRHLALLPPAERIAVIHLLPRYFARASDKAQAAKLVERTLATELKDSATATAAWYAVGVLRMQAGDSAGALEAARQAAALNTKAEEPVYLALNLINPKLPEAEKYVRNFLSGPASAELRMNYIRQLLEAQRYGDAYAQTKVLTHDWPAFPDGWLVQGTLEFQNQAIDQAQTSLNTFLSLNPSSGTDAQAEETGRGSVQAYLLLAQIAEQAQRFDEAQAYLLRIKSPKDALRVAVRQSAILARLGKMDEARAVIRSVPELQSDDARAKVSAEVQLLRENKKFQAAYDVLVAALNQYPLDGDLLYDQAMLAEKLGRIDEMEMLLRRLIVAKPDYHHAYNALGFSFAERNVHLAEARELIAKALEMAPNDPFIVDSMAWVEFRAGNAAQALKLLQSAFQARPDPEIAAHMGEVFWSLGQREQAIDIWKQAAQLSPDNETLLETTRRLQGKP